MLFHLFLPVSFQPAPMLLLLSLTFSLNSLKFINFIDFIHFFFDAWLVVVTSWCCFSSKGTTRKHCLTPLCSALLLVPVLDCVPGIPSQQQEGIHFLRRKRGRKARELKKRPLEGMAEGGTVLSVPLCAHIHPPVPRSLLWPHRLPRPPSILSHCSLCWFKSGGTVASYIATKFAQNLVSRHK